MRKRSVYFFFLVQSFTNLYVTTPAITASTTGHDTDIASTPNIRMAKIHNKNVVTIVYLLCLLFTPIIISEKPIGPVSRTRRFDLSNVHYPIQPTYLLFYWFEVHVDLDTGGLNNSTNITILFQIAFQANS